MNMVWLIDACVGGSVAGLAFVFLRAFTAGTQAYADEHAQQTARNFEDIFLFIPPRRIARRVFSAIRIASSPPVLSPCRSRKSS